jgi:hypothetical protein
MKYNQKNIDSLFNRPVFYMEMSGKTSSVQHMLMSFVDMLRMIENKTKDKKLHAKNADINALKTIIYEKDDLSKKDIQSVLNQIYNKFSIGGDKPSVSHLVNHIKSEAEKINLELSKSFIKQLKSAKEIIKKNVN